jgi:zinc transport system substrate-binding protein
MSKRFLLSYFAGGLLCTVAAFDATAAEKAIYRALIADHANGKLTLIDLMSGKIIANYGVEGPARLKASDNSKLIYAAQGAQNRVDVIDSGVIVTSHGDHADVDAKAPRMTAASILGTKPSHINMGNGRVAAFFDGEGLARVIREDGLLSGKGKIDTIKTAAPHHGMAAPVGDFYAVSIPHPTEAKELPIGIDLVDRAGKSMARSVDCPRMHGEAKSGTTSVFGCSNGVLILRMSRTGGSFEKVAYPDNLPAERMVRNMATGQAVNSFLGDFGADGMVVLDPTTKGFTFVQLPSKRMHFARDRVMGNFGFVITEEGQVHKLNALTGKIEASLSVTERYSMEGGSSVPRPRLSASGDRLVVTDPAKAIVHVIDTDKMQVVHKVSVPGAPFDPVLVGAAGGDH